MLFRSGCAGTHPVFAAPDNHLDAADPTVAGGDGFDLHELGLTQARFVRIRDSGLNKYAPPGGGFDLDAIAVVHGAVASSGSGAPDPGPNRGGVP